MLTASFRGTQRSAYFSKKLQAFVSEAHDYFGRLTFHPLSWLAIASQIAGDYESYAFAVKVIDCVGGIPLQAVIEPSLCSDFPIDDSVEPGYDISVPRQSLPPYNQWGFLMAPLAEQPKAGLIESTLTFFLHPNGNCPYEVCRSFASFCLKYSIQSAFSRILT